MQKDHSITSLQAFHTIDLARRLELAILPTFRSQLIERRRHPVVLVRRVHSIQDMAESAPADLQKILSRQCTSCASREVVNEPHTMALQRHCSPPRRETHYWTC